MPASIAHEIPFDEKPITMALLRAHGGNIYSGVQCLEHDVLCPYVDLSMRSSGCWGLSCC